MAYRQPSTHSGSMAPRPVSHSNASSINSIKDGQTASIKKELVHYTETRVTNIQDFEKNGTNSQNLFFGAYSRLSEAGKRVGVRASEFLAGRGKGGLTAAKRQIQAQDLLAYITTTLWTFMFGRPVDTFERSTEDRDEYMLTDNEPVLSRFLSLPKESALLNTNAFLAGVVEGVLVAGQFPCRVTAHSMPIPGYPLRTTILIKLHYSILDRESNMAGSSRLL